MPEKIITKQEAEDKIKKNIEQTDEKAKDVSLQAEKKTE